MFTPRSGEAVAEHRARRTQQRAVASEREDHVHALDVQVERRSTGAVVGDLLLEANLHAARFGTPPDQVQ